MSKYFAEQFRRDRLDESQAAQFLSSDNFSRLSCNLPGAQVRGLDESRELADLRKAVAANESSLPSTLSRIAESACRLTGATGAAIAMWKDGAMICRARSGSTAPPLGAELSVESGISGACFSTGLVQNCSDTENDPHVDVEVCRRLELRSIAALPIEGWRSINGILEVFSNEPFAFTEQNLLLLRQLAALAEQARVARPHGASSGALRNTPLPEARRASGFLPASDNFLDTLAMLFGTRSWPLLLAGSVVSVCLIALSMWLGWRGAKAVERHSTAPTSAARSASREREDPKQLSDKPVPASPEEGKPLSENEMTGQNLEKQQVREKDSVTANEKANEEDSVWKPNPGGEPLFISNGKPSAGVPVKFAAKIDRISTKKTVKKSFAGSSQASRAQTSLSLPPSQ